MDLPRAVTSGYDRWADRYDDADPTTALDEPAVLALAGDVAGRTVVDIGCGTGRYARLLSGAGARVIGVDPAARMLARAQRQGGARAWVRAAAERLPFAPASFARAVSGLVLDHVPQLDAYFGEAWRVLEPGGRFVLTAIHPELQRFTGIDLTLADLVIPGVLHEVEDIVAAARRAGFVEAARLEPVVDEALIARHPRWAPRLGLRALLVLALDRP